MPSPELPDTKFPSTVMNASLWPPPITIPPRRTTLRRISLFGCVPALRREPVVPPGVDRKSTRLNSSHDQISYAVFCLKKKKKKIDHNTTRTKTMHNQCTYAHFSTKKKRIEHNESHITS